LSWTDPVHVTRLALLRRITRYSLTFTRRTFPIRDCRFLVEGAPCSCHDAYPSVSASRETSSGDVILKLVNVQAASQPLRIDLQGVKTIRSDATGEVLTGEPAAINTVAEPRKVTPRAIAISNAAPAFVHDLPAHSVTVIRLRTR
jgi:alpha-L-arabinofuranosidase